MKALFPVFFLFFHVSWVSGQEITGYWKTIDDASGEAKSIVKIYQGADGHYYGKIVKLYRKPHQDPDPVCKACPRDDERHGKRVKGMVVLTSLKKNGKYYTNGDILDPSKGSTYRCKLWTDDSGNLKVRGYLGPFYRTQTWLRMDQFNE